MPGTDRAILCYTHANGSPQGTFLSAYLSEQKLKQEN